MRTGSADWMISFIVGSRISKAPYDLAAHVERHGNAFDDGQFLESTRVMGTGKAARSRRVVYHYLFARHKRDDRAINAMVDRAEKVAAGTRPLKKDRFVRIDASVMPNQASVSMSSGRVWSPSVSAGTAWKQSAS